MVRRKKLLISTCLALLFSITCLMPVRAEAIVDIAIVDIDPLWQNTAGITVGLTFRPTGRAYMLGTVTGNIGTERISVYALLERVNANGTTTRMGSWTGITVEGRTWTWQRPHYVALGHYYRLTLTATVSRNGIDESSR